MFAIEITAAIDAAGTLTTFYLSSGDFSTRGGDTPEHVAFNAALLDPGSIASTAFGDGRTGGGTRLSLGEIRVANADGGFDGWLNYSFDGRPVTIRRGDSGSYPADHTTMFTGTTEALTVNRREVIVRLRDKQLIFDKPILTNLYGGTNVLPNGLDGTADDLAGKPKPRLLGRCRNVSPPCVNTSKQVYQVNDGPIASIEAVYDRAFALTRGVDHANSGALMAASPAAGDYDTCLAEGLIRLGDDPEGEVTVDATEGPAAVDRTAAAMLTTLALEAGVSSGDLASADFAAFVTDAPATLGVWISGSGETYSQVMDRIAASVGAFYAFDPAGLLRVGRLIEPAGEPVLDIAEYDVLEPFERRPARDGDIPTWRVAVRHSRVWTVQTSDIAGGVDAARRALVGAEYRSQVAEDAAVKDQFLLAGEETIDTLLATEADAANEAARRLALRKVRRDFFDVGLPASRVMAAGLKLTSVVRLTHPRFGLSAGRLFIVLGIRLDLARNRATLTLWG